MIDNMQLVVLNGHLADIAESLRILADKEVKNEKERQFLS